MYHIHNHEDIYVLNLYAKSNRVLTLRASLRGPLIFINPRINANSVNTYNKLMNIQIYIYVHNIRI